MGRSRATRRLLAAEALIFRFFANLPSVRKSCLAHWNIEILCWAGTFALVCRFGHPSTIIKRKKGKKRTFFFNLFFSGAYFCNFRPYRGHIQAGWSLQKSVLPFSPQPLVVGGPFNYRRVRNFKTVTPDDTPRMSGSRMREKTRSLCAE